MMINQVWMDTNFKSLTIFVGFEVGHKKGDLLESYSAGNFVIWLNLKSPAGHRSWPFEMVPKKVCFQTFLRIKDYSFSKCQ